MKYWFESNSQRYRCSLVPILDCFVKTQNKKFRSSFICPSGTVLMFPVGVNIYAFVATAQDDLIKAISSNKLSMKDIEEKLDAGENIGFAAYVRVDKDFFSIVSALHGPRSRSFSDFVNQLLSALGLDNVRFFCQPFECEVSAAAALSFAFKSAIRIRVNRTHRLFSTLISELGSPSDVSSMVIELRPAKGMEMREGFGAAVARAGEDGIDSLTVRAKENAADALMDYFIEGNGKVKGIIRGNKELEVLAGLASDARNNHHLSSALTEYRNESKQWQRDLKDLSDIITANCWNSAVDTYSSAIS